MGALNQILVSSTPEDEVREMRGYIKALDKLKHLATIEDREKRDYEEYIAANGSKVIARPT